MPPIIQSYEASREAAKRLLEAAETALPRDFAQAVAIAPWVSFLRDKYDVSALMDTIGELTKEADFVARIHATADKARLQQPLRGRPPKTNNGAAPNHENAGANAIAPATI
ncbi:DNA-binding protein [Bradyrhizobium diazoefficiens]|nr:DNA-binding protein [Bradyrhizobium diazoefficiens]MBR0850258.1 DNA-binding protein [Bradyrhizobium diazoefficiens]